MKKFVTTIAIITLVTVPAMADYDLVEDFEAYDLGTVHLQGGWQAQRNSSAIGDHNFSQVIDMDGDKVLQLTNRDFGEELDTVYTAFDLDTFELTGATTTIYLQFQADGPNDTLITTNNLNPGWYDDDEDGQLDGTGQGTNNYSAMGAMAYLPGSDVNFRARDGGGYVSDTSFSYVYSQWSEMWLHIDNTTGLTTYYASADGGTPVKMNNASDDTWQHRNLSNTSVTSVKFFAGNQPVETNVIIGTLAVNTTEFTLDRPTTDPCPIRGSEGDFNCDATIGLLDLDILGQNWNASGLDPATSYTLGDANGDGEVGLLDLDILGQNWGQSTSVPEPATLGLLAIGGLLAIRRR